MQLYCSKHLNNAFRFFWKAMGLAYANPPFSLLAKVLTKIAYEGGRVVMCTPDWSCSGEHAYWRPMLDRMTVGRVQLPDGPIYVPEDSDTAMQAPEWASFLSSGQDGPPHATQDTRGGKGETGETQHQVPAQPPRTGCKRRAHTDGALHPQRQ